MSQGYGRLQLAIIAALTRTPFMDTLQLANRVYHGNRLDRSPISPAQHRSINRALKKLAATEVIEKTDHHSRAGHRTWKLLTPPAEKARRALFAQLRRKNLDSNREA